MEPIICIIESTDVSIPSLTKSDKFRLFGIGTSLIERGYQGINVRSLGKPFNDNSLVTTLNGYLG